MYQAACKMVAGANPLKTQRLLQRSFVRQRPTKEEKSASKHTAANYFTLIWGGGGYDKHHDIIFVSCKNAYFHYLQHRIAVTSSLI